MAYSSPTRPTEATDASRDVQNEDRPPSIYTAEHPSYGGSYPASDQTGDELHDANEDLPWWLTNGSHLASPGESEKAIAMYHRIHKRPMSALRLLSIITSGLHHFCARPSTGPLHRNINAGAGASLVQRKTILSAASAYRKLLPAEYQDPSSDLPFSELDAHSWPRSLRRDVAAAYEAMGPLFDVRLGEPFDLEAARSQQLLQRSTTSTFSGLGTPQQQLSIAKLHDALIRLERFNEARSAHNANPTAQQEIDTSPAPTQSGPDRTTRQEQIPADAETREPAVTPWAWARLANPWWPFDRIV